jgi:hypothetical protein
MTFIDEDGRKYYLIFRAYRRDKDGEVLYAKDFGIRAWPIKIYL